MNNLNFNTPGGFPLSTNILDAMQTAYAVFNALGNLAGNFAIISGCDVSGGSVSDGVVFINGEVLDFHGGGASSSITIKEDVETRVFENGSTNPVIFKRYATFGSSTPEKTFNWADFKRIFPTTAIEPFRKDFEDRIKALEQKKSPIPVGMVAIWNRPEPIPDGWAECTDLRGRVPLGWNPDDADFNTIGETIGEKTHKLTISEMPRHNHGGTSIPQAMKDVDRGAQASWYSLDNPINWQTDYVGGDQPHNNIQPSRIVRFIEFVGF